MSFAPLRPLLPALALLVLAPALRAEELPLRDQVALFAAARAEGHVGTAQKTKPVDARPAVAGEVIVTVIRGEGVETRSKPAEEGDWVVRNRCPETGNEEWLVKGAKFVPRYGEPTGAAAGDGYLPFTPVSGPVDYTILPGDTEPFRFTAPWGEAMVARPGDALVQSPSDPNDTYRVAAGSFACTYQVVTPAG